MVNTDSALGTVAVFLVAGAIVGSVFGFALPGSGNPILDYIVSFVQGTAGVGGLLRAVIVVAVVLVISVAADFRGYDLGVPFWTGIVVIFSVLAQFVIPDVITSPFMPAVEALTGSRQVDAVDIAVLGTAFIVVYYAARARLADPNSGVAARGPVSIARNVANNMRALFGTYTGVFAALGTVVGGAAFLSATGAAGFLANITAELSQAPVWAGYIGTLAAGYANFVADLPLSLSGTEFGILSLIVVAVVAGVAADQ